MLFRSADHLAAIRSAVKKWNRRSVESADEPVLAQLECHIYWNLGATFTDMGGTFGRPDGTIG